MSITAAVAAILAAAALQSAPAGDEQDAAIAKANRMVAEQARQAAEEDARRQAEHAARMAEHQRAVEAAAAAQARFERDQAEFEARRAEFEVRSVLCEQGRAFACDGQAPSPAPAGWTWRRWYSGFHADEAKAREALQARYQRPLGVVRPVECAALTTGRGRNAPVRHACWAEQMLETARK